MCVPVERYIYIDQLHTPRSCYYKPTAFFFFFGVQTSYRCSYFSHPLLFALRCSCIWDKCEQLYHSYSFLPLKATLKLFDAFSPFSCHESLSRAENATNDHGARLSHYTIATATLSDWLEAVFKWLSKNQKQSNYSDQSQQEQTARWTNHNS